MSTRNHLILSIGLLLVATALGSGCTQDSESAEQSADLQDSWLTHEELVADLESDGYRADGRELVKVEYIESGGSSPSGYVCIADNGNWRLGEFATPFTATSVRPCASRRGLTASCAIAIRAWPTR